MTIIKQTSILLATLFSAVALCLPVKAQTLKQYDYLHPSVMEYQTTPVGVTIPTNTPEGGFIGTLVTWTTSFDTNNTMFQTNDMIEVNTGFENTANQNMEAFLGLRVNPLGPSGFAVGGTFYNDSVLGQITGVEGWLGWGFTHYDFRLTPEIAVGEKQDAFGNKVGRVTPSIVAEKAMSATTAAGMSLDLPILFHGPQNMTPTVKAFLTAKLY